MGPKVILCDIEGTTTSISFVKDNLFPYAAQNVATFLDAKWDAEETKEAVKLLREQSDADQKDHVEGCVAIAGEAEEKAKQIESLVANVKWQMEHDRKAGPLKNLQGLMWVEAYKAGAFKGQVYEDVPVALETWTKAGRKVYIYSSGSVAIQKVHFEHSEAGDLAKYLSGYFDTKVGAKQDKGSYEAIWREVSQKVEGTPKDVLFLTDIPAEAKAAKEAGMEVVLLKRPGNAELTEEDKKEYKVVESFAEIKMEKAEEEELPAKRKIEDVAQDEVTVTPPAKVAKMEVVITKKEEKEPEAVKEIESDAVVPKETKTEEKEEQEDVPMKEAEEKKEEKVIEAPPASEEEKTEAIAATDNETPKEKTAEEDEKEVKSTTEIKEKEIEMAEEAKEQEEEKMEVDSTTTIAVNPPVVVEEEEKVQLAAKTDEEKESKDTEIQKKKEEEAVKQPKEKETDTTSISTNETSKTTEKEEPKEAVKETVHEEKPAKIPEDDNSKITENGTSSSSSSTITSLTPEPEKATNGGGQGDEKESPVTNGSSSASEAAAAAVVVENGAKKDPVVETEEAKPTNGHQKKTGEDEEEKQDNDSDKENDKSSVEEEGGKADEVSTTTTAASESASSEVEAVVVAKKCAAIEPVAVGAPTTATPEVSSVVEAES